ncbi:MAG: YmdB family metallophosphoesterase [Pseudomonadota bacterium]
MATRRPPARVADAALPTPALPLAGAALPPVVTLVGTCMNSGKTTAACALIAALRNHIPKQVRIATYIVIIATFVTMVDYVIQAISLDLYNALGAFIQLIVANCVILGRAEAYASKQRLGATVDAIVLDFHGEATSEKMAMGHVADGRVSLVHGDYRIDNMIFDARAPRVIAVLDWELSTLGHPLADVAFNCMPYHLPEGPLWKGLGEIDCEALGIPSEAQYVAAYCRRTGRDGIPDWEFFMAFGLFLTACLNFAFGSSTSYPMHMFLWTLNGFAQGMAGPPFARMLTHWYGSHERGTISSRWNINHNIGGGLAGVIAAYAASRWGWGSAFVVPGIINIVGAGYLLLCLKDTPQSEGLPKIEEYHNDYTDDELAHGKDTHETELGTRELFVKYIFKNKILWLFAAANFCVYTVRYGMLDWAPLYLAEVKGANLTDGGWAILVMEFGGIPSTLLIGWLSDKIGGRRGLLAFLCMIPIMLAFVIIILNPPGRMAVDLAALAMIGCFIYPALAMVGVSAIDSASKKAAGTAAGFVGLWGYAARTVQAKGFGSILDHLSATHSLEYAWNFILWTIVGCTCVGMVLLFFTRNIRPKA